MEQVQLSVGVGFNGETMNLYAGLCALLITFSISNGKLILDGLDQLETNLIGGEIESENYPRPVQESPDWVKFSESPPQVINTRLGERVEIECEAYGSPYPELQWLRGDRSILKARKSRGISGLTKVRSRLVIECVTRKHEGFYTCAASAGSKRIKAEPTLILVEGIGHGDLELCSTKQRQPPRIVSWTPTAMQTMGSTVKIPCTAVGNPAPHVYWIDNQNNVLNSIRHKVTPTGDLIISQLSWSDMGDYTCIAESAEGKDQISSFIYPVQAPE